MIRSMTGYARHEQVHEGNVLTWEARSVNHRFLEISFRLPEALRGHEAEFKARVQGTLGRGKVDLALRLGHAPGVAAPLALNESLVRRLGEAAARIAELTGTKARLRSGELLRWPGVVEESSPAPEGLAEAAGAGLETVLAALVEARESEGGRLADLLETRCAQILELAAAVDARMPALREQQLTRLRERVARLGVEVEPGRLEQELAMLASRIDVAEELDRLQAHVAEIRSTLGRDEPVGRRLDFLIQELNREANTLGSKSVDSDVTRSAVELKVLIEQMREQVQNVE
jgi:uncharacterized protein (TIGR00255 family)